MPCPPPSDATYWQMFVAYNTIIQREAARDPHVIWYAKQWINRHNQVVEWLREPDKLADRIAEAAATMKVDP